MNKFNSYRNIVFTLSTGLIFGAWEILSKFINCDNTFFVVIIGSISSYSFYKIVLKLVERCAIKFNFVKRFVFGRSYLDGIWVGAYIGTTNQPRYFVEYFEQDFNSLIIRSKCYYEDKKYKGEWKSTNASIDEDKGNYIIHMKQQCKIMVLKTLVLQFLHLIEKIKCHLLINCLDFHLILIVQL